MTENKFEQFQQGFRQRAKGLSKVENVMPEEMQATRIYGAHLQEAWEKFAEQLRPEDLRSVDRLIIMKMDEALQNALLNIETRLVKLEKQFGSAE